MKKMIFCALMVILSLCILPAKSKGGEHFYPTPTAEMTFSWANVDINGDKQPGIIRFSPVFNIGTLLHYDLNDNIGVFSGLTIRNVGLIFNDPNFADDLHIHRTYNLGIPLGVKLGFLYNGFLYGGYEFEFPFHYKHKYWDTDDRSGEKTKEKYWFKGPVKIQQAWFVGLQFSFVNIKFKYYLTDFLNKDYEKGGLTPYQNYDTNVLYISISANMLKDVLADLFY